MSFLTREELSKVGFKVYGSNVLISNKCSIYNPENISIGSDVRIDDFSLLSAGTGGIELGDNVHISAYVSLVGAGFIKISSFAGLSSKVSVFSSSDDYSGITLSNPTVPDKYKMLKKSDVLIGRHCLVGASAVILPGAKLEEGAVVSALSTVSVNLSAWSVYGGNPLKKLMMRKKRLLDLEKKYFSDKCSSS